jgi:hypothetical protein
MAKWSEQRQRDVLLYVIARPLLVVFWLLILWGTLYGVVFLDFVAERGAKRAFDQAMSGRDLLAGIGNLALAVGALIVWGIVGFAAWRSRRECSHDNTSR